GVAEAPVPSEPSGGVGSVVGVPGPVFHLARRDGYEPSDVDAFIDRLEALPDTPEGRRAAWELAEGIHFHLARRDGYEPSDVDRFVDAVIKSWRQDGPGPA
ncbi:MAG: hypothetical protein LBI99_00100, partial [Propionibacteriaceae bacterium]|nr:hypothetical protein [Propionibacteriaceae bacterium]